jgi:hypothetical protein
MMRAIALSFAPVLTGGSHAQSIAIPDKLSSARSCLTWPKGLHDRARDRMEGVCRVSDSSALQISSDCCSAWSSS